jgi:4-hydroxy 2-oxovalerate aldolase
MPNPELYLLDCTLRDGGYVNDWRFGLSTIRSVVRRLDAGGVDIIECGFLNSRCEYDKDRSMYPDIPSVAKTLGSALPKSAMLVAMIDFGTFDEELLIPKSKSPLNGIRLIFKKEHIDAAMAQARKIKELGYKLFLNPVAFTSYHTAELVALIEKINAVKPFGMSIVDTYGLMFDDDVERYITLVNGDLDPDIALGYHCHANVSMADAHSINYACKQLSRKMVVDATVLGMGKNAGNAKTELIAMFLEKKKRKTFDNNQILDCAYTDIQKFNVAPKWGYGLDTLLSAIHDCSPNWIKFLMGKNTLSINGIRTILDALPYEKREVSYFSNERAERKYLEYMDRYVEDSAARQSLKTAIVGRDILLLCPGRTLRTHKADIDRYLAENKPIVVTVNFITDIYQADFAFISNANRYSQMLGIVSDITRAPQVLLTSNIVPSDALAPECVFNYKTLYESIPGDNSACLLISLLKNLGVKRIAIAGMDGYANEPNDSFFDESMRTSYSDTANELLVRQLSLAVEGTDGVKWITPSRIADLMGKE